MPAHHKLEAYIDEDLLALGIRDDHKSPLFRSALGRTARLGDEQMHRIDAYRMIRRRTAQAGFRVKLGVSCVPGDRHHRIARGRRDIENGQALAADESPRTTKLYDRSSHAITLDDIQRITI